MTLKCPRCGTGSNNGQACPHCGLALTFTGALGFYWSAFSSRFCSICSPICHHTIPLNARSCPVCGVSVNLSDAIDGTTSGPREQLEKFTSKATPKTKRRVQWGYLLFSMVMLFALLTHASRWERDALQQRMMMSVVHLAMLGVMVYYFVPRRWFYVISVFSVPAKIALILNYFSALLLFQSFVQLWWHQAGVLGSLFFLTYAIVFVLSRFALPMVENVRGMFSPGPQPFDPAAPQGKRAHHD